jgi:putative hydrolase of the HAD superfamily
MYERVFERAGEPAFGGPEQLWAALSDPPDHDDPIGYFGTGFARVAAQHGQSTVDPLVLAKELLTVIDDNKVTFLHGAEDALAAAETVGSLGIVTNGPADRQQTKLNALGITDRFETIVFGAELSRSKPHALPFEHAVDDLGVSADRALYVGNSLEYDVAGAQNAGLSVAWLRDGEDAGTYSPEYVVDSLGDLASIFRGDQ